MDSMRALNKSLPSARSNRPSPPEELLPAFRQAALSVTNLYKSAASYHDSIRQAGYQDAIDDLLKFLDKENLGVQDGEGWIIRQWATAHYDVGHMQQSEGEDEEGSEHDQRQRDSSPEKPAEENDQRQTTPAPALATAPNPTNQQQQTPEQPIFQFSHGAENAMQTEQPNTPNTDSFVRMKVPRNSSRSHNRHPTHSNNRASTQIVGSKRKMPFPDISEMFNLGFERKDESDGGNGGSMGGGSKRSRFV